MTTPPGRLRVAIVDDHQVVRQGLRTFLELYPDIDVAGEAASGPEAVALAQRQPIDVMLMDLVMPGGDGIAATRAICALGTATRVIVLTSFAEDDKLFPAIQAGASSYLLKDVSPDALVEAIRAAARGEARLHPNAARRLMDAMRAGASPPAEQPAGGAAGLSEREIEVLRLIAQGLANRDIATRLVISEKTVKTHVGNLLAKLGLADRTQLAIYALRSGLAEG
jgi:NarL family two-component system response regulator LiaR